MKVTGISAQAVETPKCPECGADLSKEAMPLTEIACAGCGKTVMMPGQLGQYQIIRLIGTGGMGAVYEGVDTGLQRKVAVKVILREKAEADASFIENFKREAQSAAQLNAPNIVGVYANGEWEGQPYLVMELVQADALDKMMAQGAVNATTALSIGRQIAQGLKVAADKDMVHGDVKPENILINEAHEAKLADFGIAALISAKAAEKNEVWGTPYYVAPETLLRQKVDFRADVYSLGATLYHAIAGVPPFEGATPADVMKARLQSDPKPLVTVAKSCPEAISKIIMRMLEREPKRRYPTYDSLIADITKTIGSGKSVGKRVVLKGTQSMKPTGTVKPTGTDKPKVTSIRLKPTSATFTPSKPMSSVEENKKQGLSTRAVVGIAVGGGLAILTVLGILVGVLVKASKPAPAVQPVVTLTPQQRQALADAEALKQLGLTIEQSYVNAKTAQDRVKKSVDRMIAKAQSGLLEEQMEWLQPKEEEAPTAMLVTIQKFFKALTQIDEAIKAIEALRVKLDDWQTNHEDVSVALADATAAVEVHQELPEIKALDRNIKLIDDAEASWAKIVKKARAEMIAVIEQRQEEERKSKAAEREREAAEQAKRDIEMEVASVSAIDVTVSGELDKFMPTAAMALFKTRNERLKSDEAKAAAAVIAERINAYLRLKQAFLTAAEEGMFKKIGITAADEATITVNDKPMLWSQFLANQSKLVFKLVDIMVVNDDGAKDFRASERADLAIGAYLFIERFVGSEAVKKSKTVREAMEKLRSLAESLPGSRALFERLVPSQSEDDEA